MSHDLPEALRPLAVPLASLKPYPHNPRQGDVGAIAESLKAHNQYRPLVVRKQDNTVLCGNHTLAAARALGWQEIAATFLDVPSDDDAARIVLVDNRTSDLASNDSNALAVLLQELAATPAALQGTGYDGDALDELLADLGAPTLDALQAQHGDDYQERNFWPTLTISCPPPVQAAWRERVRAEGREEHEVLADLLGVVVAS